MRLTQGNNVFKNLVKPNGIKDVELGCWGWDAVINHTHTHKSKLLSTGHLRSYIPNTLGTFVYLNVMGSHHSMRS